MAACEIQLFLSYRVAALGICGTGRVFTLAPMVTATVDTGALTGGTAEAEPHLHRGCSTRAIGRMTKHTGEF